MRAKQHRLPKLMAGGLLVAGLAVTAAVTAAVPAAAAPQYGPAPTAPPAPQAPAPMPSHEAEAQAGAMATKPATEAPHPNRMRDLIKGKEDQPAETIFKNVRILKGVPAGKFLDTMEGFSHALGTNCKKCHDTENFASDDKKEKKAAREMIQMTQDINDKYLKAMPEMDRGSYVGCFTCHRGQSNPNARPKGSTDKAPEKPQS
jgi:hypothetical protein